jgi:hypothetical protein
MGQHTNALISPLPFPLGCLTSQWMLLSLQESA